MDFTQTRIENDQALLGRIEAIRQGDDLEVLEPFARAYLGLFYDIDTHIEPSERVDLLANSELSDAIKQGLVNVLHQPNVPEIEGITQASLKQENINIGYAILAGISICANRGMEDVYQLPEKTLGAAICCHHFISTFHDDDWYQPLLINRSEQSADALLKMWKVLIDNKQDFLPGLRTIIDEECYTPLFSQLAVPLLRDWTHCRHRDLAKLLSHAIEHADHGILLAASRDMLEKSELMNLRNKVYWQTTAFLLAPEEQGQILISFLGQEKMKLLPMLDFIIPLLDKRVGTSFNLSANGYGFLIRCLAQKFTPQLDVNNNLGEISLKVLWLFYQLACFSEKDGGSALKRLRKVRVLKLYNSIFDAIENYQSQTDKPDFDNFIKKLRDEDRLRVKKNWHDIR